MNTKLTKQECLKNLSLDRKISKTGYRALLLLKLLLKKPMSKEEILSRFRNDSITGGALSIDSVMNTINVLRRIGCIIKRPSNKTDFKYVLVSHPFSEILTKENIEALQLVRDDISTLGDWELLINLNVLYKKLVKYTENKDAQNVLIYNHKLKNVNLNLVGNLLEIILNEKQVNLSYFSPNKRMEKLEFLPEDIVFERGKLYLFGYSKKYKRSTYLRIDRIKKINFIRLNQDSDTAVKKKKEIAEVTYCLKKPSATIYTESENEKIILRNNDSEYCLTIRAKVENKFNFFQKVLSYGVDCKIISPDYIIEEFKDILASIKLVYGNE